MKENGSISRQTLQRLPLYLSYLKELPEDGYISATGIADALGYNHVQVRKDLASVSHSGRPKVGYATRDLIRDIERSLGYDATHNAVLVGAGSLGQALLGYRGFEEHNLSISLAFDSDSAKTLKEIHGVVVRPMEDLPLLVKRLKIKIGILTVPRSAAQACASLTAHCVYFVYEYYARRVFLGLIE